jgi:hypothetical protein
MPTASGIRPGVPHGSVSRFRPLLVGLLVAWCGIGLAVTVGAVSNRVAWQARAPAGVVGMPLRGAAETAAIHTLLADAPARAGERWLVLFPAGSDAQVLMYVRYQLAHTQYPRRVDLATADALPAHTNYAGIIAAPGITITGPWLATARYEGFTRHAAASS